MKAARARNINRTKKNLSPEQREELLRALRARFEKNMNRHKGLDWAHVQPKLEANAEKLWSLSEMERTGGEPDIVGHDEKPGEYIFYDCSAESPQGRRSLCYDREALESRKEHKPKDSAVAMAAAMGIELLTEEQYRNLQTLPREFRYQNVELGENTFYGQKTRRRPFLRSPLQRCFHLSQRCRILLCRQGVPWLTKGLNFASTSRSRCSRCSRRSRIAFVIVTTSTNSRALLKRTSPKQLLLERTLQKRRLPSPGERNDWPDLLLMALARSGSTEIAAWAELNGLARETVSRGFAAAYGITPFGITRRIASPRGQAPDHTRL